MILEIKNSERIFNEVYLKNLTNRAGLQIFFGGASSGKSFFVIGQRTVLDVIQGGRNYLVVRNVAATLRHSCFNEITKAVSFFKLDKLFKINKSELTITCVNGFQILFAGLDDVQKLKSITPKKGVITDIVIEEATETNYRSYKELDKRLRGRATRKKRITMLFNPIYKKHWIYEEFFANNWNDDDTEKYIHEKDAYILKTTYKDNKFLAEDDIQRIESERDEYYRNVYVHGNWGVLGNVIFNNFTINDLSRIRTDRYIIGLDWGFSSDPAAAILMSFKRDTKTLYIHKEIYASGLTNEELANVIKSEMPQHADTIVIADSAEPKSIQELNSYGIRTRGAAKGKGSLESGYRFLRGLRIMIDKNCQNTINEFNIHSWKQDKSKQPLPIPEDKNNHAIDAIRYGLESEIVEKKNIYAVGNR